MEFSPFNPVVKLSLEGKSLEEKGQLIEAEELFHQAWTLATEDFEKFIAAYDLARVQKNASEKLKWYQTALALAHKINDASVAPAFVDLYTNIATCFEALNQHELAMSHVEAAKSFNQVVAVQGPFYHGTKASLKIGEYLNPGFNSNYQSDLTMNHVYFTTSLNSAALAATMAKGDDAERIYVVEPTGPLEDDPNLTNKKFPGNLTRSYRTDAGLKIIGEVLDWKKQVPDELNTWREKIAKNKGNIIN